MKQIIIALSLIALVSCKKETTDLAPGEIQPIVVKGPQKPAMANGLGFFTEVPKEVGSCNEVYRLQGDTTKIVYVTNLQSFAMVNIDGKLLQMERDTVNSKMPNGKTSYDVFKGEGYKTILDATITKQSDLQYFETEGTLNIYHNDSLKASVKVKGAGGC
jgi:hypothetical protein